MDNVWQVQECEGALQRVPGDERGRRTADRDETRRADRCPGAHRTVAQAVECVEARSQGTTPGARTEDRGTGPAASSVPLSRRRLDSSRGCTCSTRTSSRSCDAAGRILRSPGFTVSLSSRATSATSSSSALRSSIRSLRRRLDLRLRQLRRSVTQGPGISSGSGPRESAPDRR